MDSFAETQRELGLTAEGEFVLQTLIHTAMLHPEKAPLVPETKARMLVSRAYGAYPALALIYRFHNDAIYLYGVESYDQLSEQPGKWI